MAVSELWAVGMILAAFAGGVFGASIGALPSFSLAGLLVVVGELYRLVGDTVGVEALPVDITGAIGFGVVLGPHIAFGGGAAALAYAARQGYLDSNGDPYLPKDVTRGLGRQSDVLLVGGVFGVLGYWVATLSRTLALPVDPVALGVVLSALAHRAAFGYDLVGARPRDWFATPAVAPTRDATDERLPDGGTSTVDLWLPYQYEWDNVAVHGLAIGVLGGYIAYVTASPFLAFGITVTALFLLNADVAEIPVTHHMALPASTAVLALVDAPPGALTPALVTGSVSLEVALLVGAVFGIVGALFGEVLQRILYAHADTHLDPPAASIVVTSLLIAVLAMAGVFESAVWIPTL